MVEKGHLPPWDDWRAKAATPMEHGAPTEILPVEIIWRTKTLPNFLVYLILLQLLVLLKQFLLQYFMYLFKPKGVGTSLQTYVFFLRRIFRHNYVLLPKFLKSTKWKITQRGWKFIQVQYMDGYKLGPQSGRIIQKGWKILKVHKVDGSPKEGENSYKSTKWTDHPKMVKILTSPQSGRI